MRARFHGFRARLHDVQLAGCTVFRPLDVHRALVVLLDRQRLPGQRFHLGVADAEFAAQVVRGRLDLHPLAGLVGIHHALLPAAHTNNMPASTAGWNDAWVAAMLGSVGPVN